MLMEICIVYARCRAYSTLYTFIAYQHMDVIPIEGKIMPMWVFSILHAHWISLWWMMNNEVLDIGVYCIAGQIE